MLGGRGGRAWCRRVGGGRFRLPLPGRRPWCLSRCLPRKGLPPCPTRGRSFSPASTPGGSRGPLGGRVGSTGSTARRPWGVGCLPVWRRCPFGGGGRLGGGRRGRAPLAGVLRSGLRWTWEIWSVVAWGGRAPAVLWASAGLVGVGPWLPVGVGWPGGCCSCRPSSGLQRMFCRGKRGGAVWLRCCGAVYNMVGAACR